MLLRFAGHGAGRCILLQQPPVMAVLPKAVLWHIIDICQIMRYIGLQEGDEAYAAPDAMQTDWPTADVSQFFAG